MERFLLISPDNEIVGVGSLGCMRSESLTMNRLRGFLKPARYQGEDEELLQDFIHGYYYTSVDSSWAYPSL